MSVVQISQIKHRRGLQENLPQLSSAELGWSVDSQKLYIGNGTVAEGAPEEGNTRILTEKDLPFANGAVYGQTLLDNSTANVAYCAFGNVNPGVVVNYMAKRTAATGNVAVRTGYLRISQFDNNMTYDEEYSETSFTGITFTVTQIANTYAQLSATTTSTGYNAELRYSFTTASF